MQNNPAKIRVCCGRSCSDKGAHGLMRRVENEYGMKAGTASERIDLDYCGCTGHCHTSPNVVVNGNFIEMADENTIIEDVENALLKEPQPIVFQEADLDRVLEDDILGDLK
jgi:NADH:ubiquinone oxidoreductase subunit E